MLLSDTDYSFIGYEFPFMERLHFKVAGPSTVHAQKEQIDDILKKNPQIKSIEIHDFPKDYVKVVHQHLPNITDLFLHELDIGNDKVHFEHVRSFTLYDTAPGSIENLSFSRLESLQIEYSRDMFDSWIRYLRNYSNLTRFKVGTIDDDELPLVQLTNELPELVDFSLRSIHHVKVDTICQFIDAHEMLNKIKLSFFKREDLQQLQQRYEDDWHIKWKDFVWVDVWFERKVGAPN